MEELKKIKAGKYSEKRIVELFGTEKQKESYRRNGKLIGMAKENLLTRASRYCQIEDLGNRYYSISNIYQFPLPAKWNQMNQSLYQYIIPLILENLIDGHDENSKITLTVGNWARELRMINDNYQLIKYNKEDTSEQFKINLETLYEFYNKSDRALEYYFTNALNYLKSTTSIFWMNVYYVMEEFIEEESEYDSEGNKNVEVTIKTRLATEEEMDFYTKCMKIADLKAGITSDSERYYSKKSQLWNSILKDEIYKRKFKLFFKAYQVYYVHLDRCQFLLDHYPERDAIKLYDGLVRTFTDLLLSNTEKRIENNPGKYDEEHYSQYVDLCDMVINPNTEYLGGRIKKTNMFSYQLNMKVKRI